MQKVFKLRTLCYSLRNPNDLAHIRPNPATFGSNSLMFIGPQIWNNLPNELKSVENLKNIAPVHFCNFNLESLLVLCIMYQTI